MPAALTYAEVDHDALRRNLSRIRAGLRPRTRVLAVVKADGYGHGAIAVSRTLAEEGVESFMVAAASEGVALRQSELEGPEIIVSGGLLEESYPAMLAYALTPVLSSAAELRAWVRAAEHAGRNASWPAPFHLELDTGMSRLGIPVAELDRWVPEIVAAMQGAPVKLVGIMSHLANADLDPDETSAAQLEAFRQALRLFEEAGVNAHYTHLSNSAGMLRHESCELDAVRPGLALYGLEPGPNAAHSDLEPVLSWHTRVVSVRDVPAGTGVSYGHAWRSDRPARIATLPVGYADGYRRGLGGRAEVLIRGRRAPVVGAVCMDLCMIDVTHLPAVEVGDRVALLGSDGDERIGADELAAHLGTISWEVLTGIGGRVPRFRRGG